jgi:hypothetical protein
MNRKPLPSGLHKGGGVTRPNCSALSTAAALCALVRLALELNTTARNFDIPILRITRLTKEAFSQDLRSATARLTRFTRKRPSVNTLYC